METQILFKITKVEFFETGKKIDDLSFLKGATIIDVEDQGLDVILTIDKAN